MGDAKPLVGHLTRREQIVLGLTLNASRGKQREDGLREERRRKREAFAELGMSWVAERAEKMQLDPTLRGTAWFTPDEMRDETPVPFSAGRGSIDWVLEQLDRTPLAGVDDFVLGVIDDRLRDVKSGDYKAPAPAADSPPTP